MALDEKGRSSFQLLQGGELSSETAGLFFYAFDILNVNGRDTTGLPLLKRKALLQTLLPRNSDCIRYSDLLTGDIKDLSSGAGMSGVSEAVAGRPNQDVRLSWMAQMEGLSGIPSLLEEKIYVPFPLKGLVRKFLSAARLVL